MPKLSHSKGHACFYEQRSRELMNSITNLSSVNWGQSSQLILEEGFYMFGGLLSDGTATDGLWILKSQNNSLRWVKGDSHTSGKRPSPRYSHSLTYYEKENALIIAGGRNDRENRVFDDLYVLSLDTLNWIRVSNIGEGMIGRADHYCITADDNHDFVLLGGIDQSYQLSNKITLLTFDQDSIAYQKRQMT